MPRKVVRNYEPSAQSPTDNPEEVSLLRRFLATGTRGVAGTIGGMFAMEPGVGTGIGAAIGGGGEYFAQMLEGRKDINEALVASEAALTAVPFGRWIRGGKFIKDAALGGLQSGVGEAGRQWAEGEDLSLGKIAGATGVGGTLGGAAGAGIRYLAGAPTPPKIAPQTFQEQVKAPNGEVVDVTRINRGKVGKDGRVTVEGGDKRFSNRQEYEDMKALLGFDRTPQYHGRGPVGNVPDPYAGYSGPIAASPRIKSDFFGDETDVTQEWLPEIKAEAEERGLKALLDYLQLDEGYRNASKEGRRALGPAFGRAQAEMKAANNIPNIGDQSGFIDPSLLGGVAGGIVGGAYGATDDTGPYDAGWQNRLRNATLYGLGGAAVGAGGTRAAMRGVEGTITDAKELGKMLPNIQRFNILSNPVSLGANAVVGPYGSAVSGGLEDVVAHGLKGQRSQRGETLLGSLTPRNYAKTFRDSWDESGQMMREGDMGRADFQPLPDNAFGNLIGAPGRVMGQGDIASRKLIQDAGFDEKVARDMTLTGDAESPMMSNLQNLTTKDGVVSTVGQLMFPFRRTPVNVVEQGVRRLPGIGLAAQAVRGGNRDSWNDIAAQQLLGAGYMGAGFLAGENVDPETARWLRRYVTNASGRYGLGAGIGFTMGQAEQRRAPETTRTEAYSRALTSFPAIDNYLPLPTVQPFVEAGRNFSNAFDENPDTAVQPPRGSLQSNLYDFLFPRQSRRVVRNF